MKRLLILAFSFLSLFNSRTLVSCTTGNSQDASASVNNDLSRRLEVAVDARKSSDPVAIGNASQQVIALALVQMAKIRLDAKAYDEAAKLCRDSLRFDDTAETRVELAITSLFAKKPSDAVKEASTATEMDPQSALAWTIQGEALLRTEDYAGAASALQRAIGLKRDAEPLYALGMAQLGMGEKQKAADTFNQLLALTGDSGWSRVLVGRAYQMQKLPQEAIVEFRKALRLDPHTPNAHYFWAWTLLQANSLSITPEIRSHLQEELKLNPRHFLAIYLLGIFASMERNYGESDRYLRLAAELKPSLPEIWMYLGLNENGRNARQSAESYLRKAIFLTERGSPKEHLSIRQAYFVLGRILISSGGKREAQGLLKKGQELQLEEAAQQQKRMGKATPKDEVSEDGGAVAPYIPEADNENSFSVASDQSPASGKDSPSVANHGAGTPHESPGRAEKHLSVILGSSLNDLATAEALQDKYDLAAKHYREAARWDSQIPGLQRNLGLAAFFVGENDEAIRLLAKAVIAAPSDAHARAVLGLAYFAKENFAKAVQTISPIADRALQDPQLGFAWAKSLVETGSKRAAARALESLEETNLSFSAGSLAQFGQLWQELGEEERAEQSFRRALLLDPTNSDVKCDLGIALLQLSRTREAADLFLSVLADRPDHLEAHYQLGRALLEMGNASEAVRHLEEAARAQPARLSVHLDLEAAYRKAGRTAEADREHVLCEELKNRRRTARSTP